jgi:hypothetical protein
MRKSEALMPLLDTTGVTDLAPLIRPPAVDASEFSILTASTAIKR